MALFKRKNQQPSKGEVSSEVEEEQGTKLDKFMRRPGKSVFCSFCCFSTTSQTSCSGSRILFETRWESVYACEQPARPFHKRRGRTGARVQVEEDL